MQELVLLFAGLGLITSALGLFYSGWAVRESGKTREIQILADTYKDLDNLAEKIFGLRGEGSKKGSKDILLDLDDRLFNRIELFSLLRNEKHIKNEKLASYFDNAIVEWYEKIFVPHHTKTGEVDDPEAFSEMKKLYRKIKAKQNLNAFRNRKIFI